MADPVRAHLCERLERDGLRRWLTEEAPDALLAEQDDLACELQKEEKLVGKRPIISCSTRPLANGEFPFPGNHDQPRQIGATAVEILTRMVTIGKRGIPRQPQMTLVDGTWVGGPIAAAPRRPDGIGVPVGRVSCTRRGVSKTDALRGT